MMPPPMLPEQPAGAASMVVAPSTPGAMTPVLSHPTTNVKMIAQLPAGFALTILGQEGPWLYVQLPNGQRGYVARASTTSPAATPFAQPQSVVSWPVPGAPVTPYATKGTARQPGPIYGSALGAARARSYWALAIMIVSAIALFFGIFFGGFELFECPLSNPDPYSGACTFISAPYAGTGIALIIGALVGVVIAIILLVSARRLTH